MAQYQNYLRQLKQASEQMENNSETYHPELAGKPTPGTAEKMCDPNWQREHDPYAQENHEQGKR